MPPTHIANEIRWLTWYVSELCWWAKGVEVRLSANSEAIEAVVTQLGKVREEVLAKIAALQAAVDAGEDLSGPLADLTTAAQSLDDVVPDAAPETPAAE